MLLGRMDQTDKGFYCKSCHKEVTDFREMSAQEIQKQLKKGGCGIFLPEQLVHRPKLSVLKRVAFYGLMGLSFLGFQVQPLQAQTPNHDEPKSKKEIRKEKKEKRKAKRNERRWSRRAVAGAYG